MKILDEQIFSTFIANGPWALLTAWLLWNGMKDIRNREEHSRTNQKETLAELRQLREDHKQFFRVMDVLIGHELERRGINLIAEKRRKEYEKDVD